MQNVKNWNSRIKTFFTELKVGHLNYIEHTINQPAVMEYMNTILGDYCEKSLVGILAKTGNIKRAWA